MKKNIINTVGVILTIALITAGILLLGKVFSPTEMDMAVESIDAFTQLPQDSVEVMVFGSSRAWRGVDVMEMYRNYGVGAYNYACNWQHINTTAMYVDDALLTQSPRVVLVEMGHVNWILEDVNPDGEIYYSRNIKNTPKKEAFLKECFNGRPDRYFAYFIPLGMFHSQWGELTKEHFDLSRLKGSLDSMGMCVDESNIDEQMANSYKLEIPDWHEFWQDPLSERSVAELDHIIVSCRQKGTEVILFTLPYEGDEFFYHDELTRYAQENGCVYLDFFDLADEVGLDGATDFSDNEHLNASGAIKMGDYLGKYISENYEVTDFRSIPGNLWER